MQNCNRANVSEVLATAVADMKGSGTFTREVRRRLTQTGRMARRSGLRLKNVMLGIKQNPETHGVGP